MRSIAICALAAGCVLAGCARSAETTPPASFEQLARESLAQIDGRIALAGLKGDVEVLRDEWGVPHIYAANVDDLFFAQGFVVAQDRLWQMEVWRRTGEGRTAELVGPAGVPHDRLYRLLKFRGPFDEEEWSSYHPEGKRIFSAYAAGVNAFIPPRALDGRTVADSRARQRFHQRRACRVEAGHERRDPGPAGSQPTGAHGAP